MSVLALVDRYRESSSPPPELAAIELSSANELVSLARSDPDRAAWALFVLDGLLLRAYAEAAATDGILLELGPQSLHVALAAIARRMGVGITGVASLPDVPIAAKAGEPARVLDELAHETAAFSWRFAANGTLAVAPERAERYPTGYAALHQLRVIRIEATHAREGQRVLRPRLQLRFVVGSALAPLLRAPHVTVRLGSEQATVAAEVVDGELAVVSFAEIAAEQRAIDLEARIDILVPSGYVELPLMAPAPGRVVATPGARIEVTDARPGAVNINIVSTVADTSIPVDQLVGGAILVESEHATHIASVRRTVVAGQTATRAHWSLHWKDDTLPRRIHFRAIAGARLASHRIALDHIELP